MHVIFFIIYLALSVAAHADQPQTALDSAPSVDSSILPKSSIDAGPVTPAANEEDSDVAPAMKEGAPTNYVYDLKKLISKSRENIKRVNEKIKDQAVMKRNQKREERAREYYERGLQLSEEGKLDEAREYFDKAIRITEHPEMTRYIQKSEVKLKAQETALKREEKMQVRQEQEQRQVKIQDAQGAYEEAVRLYKEKKYKEAKDQFEYVQELQPDFKATTSYLRIIDQDIIKEEVLSQKQQKVEIERQQKQAEEARQKEKDVWKKEIEKKEVERKEQVNKQAQSVYDEAVELYNQKKFFDAKKRFQEVEWVLPDYKATRNYLGRIDKDIDQEQQRVEAEKVKQLARQQWEEEVARRKKESEEKAAAELKEKERVKQLQEQAVFLYQAAMDLYTKGQVDEALEKFKDIENTLPGYKSTRLYIAKIERMKDDKVKQEKLEAEQKAKAELEAKEKAERAKSDAVAQEARKIVEQEVEAEYDAAINLYEQKDYVNAEEKFKAISVKLPGFKKTDYYIRKTQAQLKRTQQKTEVPLAVVAPIQEQVKITENQESKAATKAEEKPHLHPGMVDEKAFTPRVGAKPIEPPRSREEEIAEAKLVEDLATRSSEMLKMIIELASDKRMVPARRKMTQVDEMLTKLRRQKEAILKQIREAEEAERQRRLKEEQEAFLRQIEAHYDQAIMYLRNEQFDEAKALLVQIQDRSPNYRSTKQYLDLIETDRPQAVRMAVLERTNAETRRLRDLEEKRRREEEARKAAEEERRQKLRQAQEMEIQSLAEKASILNDYILSAAKARDFALAKTHLDELEQVLNSIVAIKQSMSQEEQRIKAEQDEQLALIQQQEQKVLAEAQKIKTEEQEKKAKLKAIEDERRAKELKIKSLKEESAHVRKKKDAVLKHAKAIAEYQDNINVVPHVHAQKKDTSVLQGANIKNREVIAHRKEAFAHALKLYNHRRFSAAKLIFDDLAEQKYPGARAYVKRIEHIMQNRIVKVKSQEEKKRTDFISQHIQEQRKLSVLESKERLRQRHLTQELEVQKRVADEQAQRDRVRFETLKLKEKERQKLLEQKKKQEEIKSGEESELSFRKLPKATNQKAPNGQETNLESKVKPIPAEETEEVVQEDNQDENQEEIKEALPIEITPKMRESQQELSDKRKKFFEDQYQKEEKARKEKELKEEQAKKILEEKEERAARIQQQIQERLQKAEQLKEDKKKAIEQKKQDEVDRLKALEERKEKDRVRKQEELERQEQLKQEKIRQAQAKAEQDRRDKEVREQQRVLDAQRKEIQSKLMQGAEEMYVSAQQLYKSGQYEAAAAKFQDIEDIVPDYKQSRAMILKAKQQAVAPTAQIASSASTASSRTGEIQKTLDVFDPNAP